MSKAKSVNSGDWLDTASNVIDLVADIAEAFHTMVDIFCSNEDDLKKARRCLDFVNKK